MFFTQYVSSTFLILIQLYVSVSVQAATSIQNMNPLLQAPIAPLLQAIPGLVSQDTKLVSPLYGQGRFDQDKEWIMNQVMQSNLGPGIPVNSILGQQPVVPVPQGTTLQDRLDLLQMMLGKSNSTIGGNAPYADRAEEALQYQEEQQQLQSHYNESTKHPTTINDYTVTSKMDEQAHGTGSISDLNIKGKGVCEDKADCALLSLSSCIADEVVWDDCPKMCGQCPRKEPDTEKLPKPLTPDQLSKMLKPTTVPTSTLPLPVQMTMQQQALANLYWQLQRQQLPLANLLTQQGIASPNPALQLHPLYNKLMPQLQRLLSPVTTLPQQGILPQEQCFCSKLPLPKELQALLQPQSHLQNIIQHQPQALLQPQSPLQKIIQHQPQALLQPWPLLLKMIQSQPQALLQPQSPLQKIIQSQLQDLLTTNPLLPNIIQSQPQVLLQPQSPLQNLIQSQLFPQYNPQQQLQLHSPSSANLKQHSSSCQQLTDLLTKMQPTNFLQGATPQNPSLQIPNPAPSNLLLKMTQAIQQNPSLHDTNPAPSNLNQVLKSLAVSPLKTPSIPLQNLNQVQNALPLNILNANPNYHYPGLNILHVGKNPLQDAMKQLQTQLLIKKIYNPQLGGGNKHLQLNALRILELQKSFPSPMQILQANLQNLHNFKTMENKLPMNHHLGNNRLLGNNIINSLLTSNLAMNRAPIKRSTKSQKLYGELGLIKNLVQPVNAARDTKSFNAKNIAELYREMGLIKNLVQPVNAARDTKSINAKNTAELYGELGLIKNLVQPVNTARDTKSTNAKNIAELYGEMGLIKNLVQPVNAARDTKSINSKNIAEQYGKMDLIKNLVQPVNAASNTKSINAKNIAELYGELGLIKNLVQPVNAAMDTKSIKAKNIAELYGEMGLTKNLVQPVNAARDTKSINAKNIAGLLNMLPGLQQLVPSDPSSLNSSVKTANKSSEDQDATTVKIILEDTEKMVEEIEHLNSKENVLTETSDESQTGSTLPKREIQLNETLSEENLHKHNSNSNISESESSTDALSEESISRAGLSSNRPSGGLLLASQLLKEARSDLSTIDNIISSYSTNENEFSELSSKINEDRSIISQDHIRSDISFEGIDKSGLQNNLEAVVDRKLNDDIRYNDKLSPDDGFQNLSEKKESTDNITQLESLLESRLEADKNTESLSLNDKSTDNALGVVSELVSEAQSDLSKIQDDLNKTISLQSAGQKEKRESVPQKNYILQAANLLNNANLDLSSIHESIRKAKDLNYIKLKHSDSEVIEHGDSDDVLIGNEAEYSNYPRVKRVLNDHEFFRDY